MSGWVPLLWDWIETCFCEDIKDNNIMMITMRRMTSTRTMTTTRTITITMIYCSQNRRETLPLTPHPPRGGPRGEGGSKAVFSDYFVSSNIIL